MKTRYVPLVALFFAVAAVSSHADGLRICPSCGREDEVGVEKCASCGHALPQIVEKAENVPAAVDDGNRTDFAKSVFDEVAVDIREARGCAEAQPGRALAIYENAIAMLAAQGALYDKKAAAAIADDIGKCKAAIATKCPGITARRLAIQGGIKDAALYFKSVGRVPCGRVWIPIKWNDILTPTLISAVRQANPPVCVECAGVGHDVCKKCNATGKEPCRHPGCKQGWVYEASQNDLSPKSALKVKHKCPECNGSSWRKCLACNGGGAVICAKCRGTGEAPICTSCNGTGLVECRDCRRAKADEAECSRCKGTHSMLCRKCGGDGRVAR